MPIAEPLLDISALIASIRDGADKTSVATKPVEASITARPVAAPIRGGEEIPSVAQAQAAFNRSVLGSLEAIAQQMRKLDDQLSTVQGVIKLISARQALAESSPSKAPADPTPAPVAHSTGRLSGEIAGEAAATLVQQAQTNTAPRLPAVEEPAPQKTPTIEILARRFELLEMQALATAKLLAEGKNSDAKTNVPESAAELTKRIETPPPAPRAVEAPHADGVAKPNDSGEALARLSETVKQLETNQKDQAQRMAQITETIEKLTHQMTASETSENEQREDRARQKAAMSAMSARVDQIAEGVGAAKGFVSEADHRLSQLEMELPEVVRDLSKARHGVGDASARMKEIDGRLESRVRLNADAVERLELRMLRIERALRTQGTPQNTPSDQIPGADLTSRNMQLDPMPPQLQSVGTIDLGIRWQPACVDLLRGRGQITCLSCGRGELLEGLLEAGIRAVGVEPDATLADLLSSRGLPVVNADPNHYLNALPDSGTDALFIGRHLQRIMPDEALVFLQACYQKLRFAGVVAMELTNVECPEAMAAFYSDPGNQRPVPLPLLRLLFQQSRLKLLSVTFVGALNEKGEPAVERSSGGVMPDARNYPVCLVAATRQ